MILIIGHESLDRADLATRKVLIAAIALHLQPQPPMKTMMIHNIREHELRMIAIPEKHERREGREKPRAIDRHRFRK